MKTNYHTHSTWCDGRDDPETIISRAIELGFDELGFSSHAMLPEDELDWVLRPGNIEAYAIQIRSLAKKYAPHISILCGVEADYVKSGANPDRLTYAQIAPDYIIGSVHFAVAPDGCRVPVDHTPELLEEGIEKHFNGSARDLICAYFQQQRDMVENFDFDIVAHPDLVRKFNARHPFFDEGAQWYVDELEKSARAIAGSGKIVEVNTGAISRRWLDDAYPSPLFRQMLREMGVGFLLSSDAHAAAALDGAFDRFSGSEDFLQTLPERKV